MHQALNLFIVNYPPSWHQQLPTALTQLTWPFHLKAKTKVTSKCFYVTSQIIFTDNSFLEECQNCNSEKGPNIVTELGRRNSVSETPRYPLTLKFLLWLIKLGLQDFKIVALICYAFDRIRLACRITNKTR